MSHECAADYLTDTVEFHDFYRFSASTLYAKVFLVQLAKQYEWKEIKFIGREAFQRELKKYMVPSPMDEDDPLESPVANQLIVDFLVSLPFKWRMVMSPKSQSLAANPLTGVLARRTRYIGPANLKSCQRSCQLC